MGKKYALPLKHKWIEAGGSYQFPFMGAISRLLKGEYTILCPKCRQATLRGYFHVFDKIRQTGTMWIWCPHCRTTSHLPRIKPHKDLFDDPFSSLDLKEFAMMELNDQESLLDQLDRLWEKGELQFPSTVEN